MYFNAVCQEIDLLSQFKFENDKIVIKCNPVNRILSLLEQFTPDLTPEKMFEIWYYESDNCYRMHLQKTATNSIGDQVNPEFLVTLKKATRICFITVAADWKLCEMPSDLNNESIVEITHSAKMRGGASFVIEAIVKENKLFTGNSGRRYLYIDADGLFFITECWKNIKLFSEIMRMEALGKTPLSLQRIIAREICYNPKSKEDLEDFPEAIQRLVAEETPFCIKI